jgi:hypothetical protein
MLAPMIRETPAAIEKNAVAEEMSRMVGRQVKSTLQHEPGLARGKKFPFTRLAGSYDTRRIQQSIVNLRPF